MTTPAGAPPLFGTGGVGFSILLVALALFSVGLGQSLVFAVIPPAARHLGLSEIEVGVVFGISAIFWMGMSPVWGRWSDRVGRRRVLILGLSGYALSLISFASALHLGELGLLGAALWPLLILGRAINGILGSATRPAALGYVADMTPPGLRAPTMARVESGFTLGTVLGPAFGSLLLIYSLLAPFYLFAALALSVALICLVQFRDGGRYSLDGSAVPSKSRLRLLDLRVRPQLLIAAIASVCNVTVLVCLGFYLEDVVRVAATEVSFYASLCLALAAASTVFAQWVLVPLGALQPRLLVQAGSLSLMLSLALLAVGTSLPQAAVAMVFYGVGFGMLRPGNSAMLSLSVRDREQGAASGLLGMVVPTGHALSPLLVMPLYSWRPDFPFWFAVAAMATIFALVQFHPRFRRVPWQLRPGGTAP